MENMLNQWIADHGIKPLAAEEEMNLSLMINNNRRLQKKLEWYHRKPGEAEEAFADESRMARETLVTHTMPLGIGYARKYASRYPEISLTCEDLEQEAFLGIMHAAELYSPDEGTKFSTYAVFWIEQYIRRAIEDKGYVIRKPASAYSRLRSIGRCGRNATTEEIAEKTGLSRTEITFLRRTASMLTVSLERGFAGEDGEDSMHEEIPDPTDFREMAEDNLLRQQLRAIIRSIPDKNRRTVMEMHLGMNQSGTCFSNRQISAALGIKLSEVTGIISRTERELVRWNALAGLPLAE